jgi:malate dehydrogenase
LFQKNGLEKIHGTGDMSPFEKKLLDAAMNELRKNIKTGVDFAKSL